MLKIDLFRWLNTPELNVAIFSFLLNVKNGFIKLPKIGQVEINQHRLIPEGFQVKGVRIVSRVRGTINFKMSSKGFLGKHMLDGGFGQFRDLLSWVCWKQGKYFAQVDHKFTSQICPRCMTSTGKKELKERKHICPKCNYSTTRDRASAEVILNRGLESIVPMDCRERKLSTESVLPGVAISR